MPAKTTKPKKDTPSKPGTIGHPIKKPRVKKAPKVSQKQKQTQSVTVNVNATAPRARPRQSRAPASGPKPTPSISNYNFPNPAQPYYHNSPWSSLDNGRHFGSGQSQQQQTAFMNMFTGQMQQILNPFMEQMRQAQAQPPVQAPVEQPQSAYDQQDDPTAGFDSQPMDTDQFTDPEIKTESSVPVFTTPSWAESTPTESQPMDFETTESAEPAPVVISPVKQRKSERGAITTEVNDDEPGFIVIRVKDMDEASRLERIAKRIGNSSLQNDDRIDIRNWAKRRNNKGNDEYYSNTGLRWNSKSKKLSLDVLGQ